MRLFFLILVLSPFFGIAQDPISTVDAASEFADEQILQQVYQDLGSQGSHDQLPYNFLNSHTKTTEFQKGGYIYDDFQQSVVIDREGKSYSTLANYYILTDEIQVYDAEKKAIQKLAKRDIVLVKIGRKDFVPKAYYDKEGQIKVGFLELISLGKRSLYRRYFQREQTKASHPLYGGKMDRKIKMVTTEELFQSKEGEVAKKMKKGKKNVLKVLAKRKKAISQYAKENGIGARKVEDIALLFNKYNELAAKGEAKKKEREAAKGK